ncbi:MAG: HAMP domain-containing protein [Treponema sp.]|jgi:nitrogen fixation/metabolism regulation signal transduction histidine kinase|nr:HAMP domain-containing protein [Treponema sp.]
MVRTQPKYAIINVRGLILLYILLCVLTILFSHSFFTATLEDGSLPGLLNVIVFFTVPGVLLVFMGFSLARLLRDMILRRTGSKFQGRLMAYFIITVALAAAPVTIITIQSVYELVQFWRSVNLNDTLQFAQNLALENYAMNLERFEKIAQETDFSALMARPETENPFPQGLVAIQDFRQNNEGAWTAAGFQGSGVGLPAPPAHQAGFVSRELPRDMDAIRYVLIPRRTLIRVLSFSLGEGFDAAIANMESERARFEVINSLNLNVRPLVVYYYGIFLLPTLLMTIIITISFSRRITAPIAELAEATTRVAAGDFSIQILSRPGDELGRLIGSFNAMVRNLEQSQNALLKAEKISVWQSMAQQLAHEIKNPLTPIKLSAERALRRWRTDPERIGEILESSMLAIIQEVEGLSTMLTEFKTLSRPTELSRTWTVIRDQIEESIGIYRDGYPEISFDITHVGAGITVKMEKRYFAQILSNLIINGIDAIHSREETGEPGRIEIRTDLVKKRDTFYCRLSVKDNGKGIAGEEGARLFTPYFTTKDEGTGLGLPIVERIVSDHGGAIWFNSALGAGATFFIDLPIGENQEGHDQNSDN